MEGKEKLHRKFLCNVTVKKKLKLFVNLNALILRLLKKEHLMRIIVLPSLLMLVSLDERNRVKRENRSENIRMTRVNIKDFGIYTIKKKYRTKNIRENVKIK